MAHVPAESAARARRLVPLLAAAATLLSARSAAASPGSGAALDFAELAHLADLYRSVRYEEAAAAEAGWRQLYRDLAVVDLAETQNRYAVGTVLDGSRQEIVVRGTANLRNAILDAEVAKSWNPELGVRLHRGFERSAQAVYRDLLPRLHREAELVLFGHSLGAAEAVILGLLLRHDGFRVVAVYASGQPKITDAQGALVCGGLPVLRISCEGDPVPLLPPRTAISWEPYVHFGPEILLLDGPYYLRSPEPRESDLRLAELWRMLRSENPRAAIQLHLFYPNYYDKYRAKAAGAVEKTDLQPADPTAPATP